MKKRKTLKEIYLQHKGAIKIAIVAIAAIVLFICGYHVSWNVNKPLNDSQLKLCEQIARDVYAQKENVMAEIPENFSVIMTKTTITVQPANSNVEVIVKLQNGQLVIKQHMQKVRAVICSIGTGVAFILAEILLFIMFSEICKNSKKKSEK